MPAINSSQNCRKSVLAVLAVDYSILVYFGAISVFVAAVDGKTKAIAHSLEISMTKYVPHFVYILIIFE